MKRGFKGGKIGTVDFLIKSDDNLFEISIFKLLVDTPLWTSASIELFEAYLYIHPLFKS